MIIQMQLSNNKPIIHSANRDNILIAAKMLQSGAQIGGGEIVAFPTETVYGLGAAAHDELAVQKIYTAKGRPSNNPLIIHVDGLEMAQQYGVFNERALALAKDFFPAPLTLVVPLRKETVASGALAGGDTVAIRCPSHPVALALIKAAGFGIAAPSANISGEISPTTAQHVATEFAHLPLFILDGGACEVGLESTVLDCTGDELRILRHGSIFAMDMNCSPLEGERVSRAISEGKPWGADNNFIKSTLKSSIKSPGQFSSHYAPKSLLHLNVVSPEPYELYLGFGDYHVNTALNLSESGCLIEAAHNLYDYLRRLDEIAQNNANISNIACAPIPNQGLGIAINDRLARAAFAK